MQYPGPADCACEWLPIVLVIYEPYVIGSEKNRRIKPETINGQIYWCTPEKNGSIPAFPGVLVQAGKRNAPGGTVISNCTPFPGSPFSVMVMPVIARISRERKRPRPVCLPKPFWKSFFLSSAEIPTPLSR